MVECVCPLFSCETPLKLDSAVHMWLCCHGDSEMSRSYGNFTIVLHNIIKEKMHSYFQFTCTTEDIEKDKEVLLLDEVYTDNNIIVE